MRWGKSHAFLQSKLRPQNGPKSKHATRAGEESLISLRCTYFVCVRFLYSSVFDIIGNSYFCFQLNRMTSWIDGSFIYSTQEVWVSKMRTFHGDGSLKWGKIPGLPPHNKKRVPLFNHQSPHFLRMTDLEKMFREYR